MHLVDVILILSVNPGFGGQAFLPEVLPKTRQLRQMIAATGREIDLEIDGGVNTQTAATCVEAGVNVLIAGSAVFNSAFSVQAGIDALRAAVGNQKAG
jgi:ribulose-phosphate 3-epimerase